MNTHFDYQPGLNDYLKSVTHGLILVVCISIFPSKLKNIQAHALADFILTQDVSSSPSRLALEAIKQYPQQTTEKSALLQNEKYVYQKLEVSEPTLPFEETKKRSIGSVVAAPIAKRLNQNSYQDLLNNLNEKEKTRLIHSQFTAGDYQDLAKQEINEVKKIEGQKKIRFGHLELSNGLALTDKYNIQVKQVIDGKTVAVGIFDPRTADYKIETSRDDGYIEASLHDENGQIIGYGYYAGPENNTKIQIKQNTNKKNKGTSIKVKDFYNGGQIKYRVKTYGDEFEPGDESPSNAIQNDSIYTGLIAAKKQVSTSAIIRAGEENNIIMVPESYLEAYLEFFKEKNILLETNNFYFSKISQDGQPLVGLTVEIEQNENSAAQVVYFNEFHIPDFERQNTSTNGEFSIVNLNPGAHMLSFKRGDQIVGFRNIYIAESSAVKEEINFSQYTHPAQLYYYDAITGEPLDGVLSFQGLSDQVEVFDGKKSIILADYNHTGYVFAEEDEIFTANYFLYDQPEREFYFPRIQKKWLSEARAQLKISDDPFGKSVVGFVDSKEDFDVFVPENRDNHLTIQFFDQNGKFLPNSEGSAGGGFIIFGAQEDSLNVVVIPKTTEVISSRFTILDSGITSVLKYKF